MTDLGGKLDKMIAETVISLMCEVSERVSKVDVAGSIKSGNVKGDLKITESRAFSEPKALAADLKLSTAAGASDLEMAASILDQAVSRNKIMAAAFARVKKTNSIAGGKGDSALKPGYEISVSSDVGRRDGTKFLYATLIAAEGAGLLRMKKGVGFVHYTRGTNPTIYAL